MEVLKQVARLFGWKNKQYESLHEWNRGGWKIRVWRQNEDLGAAYLERARDLESVIDEMFARGAPAALEVHDALMRAPRVACVAIVDSAGNGVSAYPDWH